jgi:hypothetical protein
VTAENQVVDAELEATEAAPETAEDQDSDRPTLAETAPQCAGCHRRGIELTLLENGKRYCDRCAHEVERLMGIGPLFAAAEGSAGEHPADDDLSSDLHDETPPIAPAAALIATLVDDGTEDSGAADKGPDEETPGDEVPYAPLAEVIAEESAPVHVPTAIVTAAVEVEPEPEAEASATPTPIMATETVAPTTELDVESRGAPPSDDAPERFTGLDAVVAGANHDAANSSNPHIPRPTASQMNAVEEPPLMERVQEQTRPTPLEVPSAAPAVSPAPPPAVAAAPASDLAGVLAAERARLLDQRELLEARFRIDVEAIDERLLHVESLLSDERTALAS